MVIRTVTGLGVCAGIGGFERGLQQVFGKQYKCLGYVERDAFAASVLVGRMEDSSLDPAPIWDELETFPCELYRGRVDIISAGFPCQPYAPTGNLLGDEDERAIWSLLVDLARDIEPGAFFFENVPNFRKHSEGLFHALEELGYQWSPTSLVSANYLGAPHRRERLFLLATRPSTRQKMRTISDGYERDSADRGSDSDSAGSRPNDGSHFESHPSTGWGLSRERETIEHVCERGCRICGTPWEKESPAVRIPNELPARLHGGAVNERSRTTSSSTSSIPISEGVSGVRSDEEPGQTSSESRKVSGDSGSLSEVSYQSRPSAGTKTQEAEEGLSRLWTRVSSVQPESDVLQEVCSLANITGVERAAVGGTFSHSGLRVLRDQLRESKQRNEDVFQELRRRTTMVHSQREDRCRVLGNSVVPDAAALAFRKLISSEVIAAEECEQQVLDYSS